MRFRVAVLALMAGVLPALVAMPPPAYATNFGGSSSGPWYADNFHHVFYYDNLTQTFINVVNWNRSNNYDPTDLTTNWTAVHGIGSNDVHVFDDYYNQGWYGIVSCPTKSPLEPTVCLDHHVRFDNNYDLTYDQQRSVGCHEIGHTVALLHRNVSESCMSVPDFPMFLPTHERNHINNYY